MLSLQRSHFALSHVRSKEIPVQYRPK